MSGWDAASHNWHRIRRDRRADMPEGGRWTPADVVALVAAFLIRWELGLAFLALKLWHQANGDRVSTFAFARGKWEALVHATRRLAGGGSLPFSLHVGPRSSGNAAFDRWRREELVRLDNERNKLASAEREFALYRDELIHAKDSEDFERFMRARDTGGVQ